MNFDQEPYFPPSFTYLGYVGLVASSVFMLIGNVVAGFPVLMVALGLVFTKIGCRVDTKTKTITNYVSVMGLVFGSPFPYKELKKLIVKPNEISQVLNSRGSSTTLHYTIFNAYLFYDDESILLTGHKKKEKMVGRMKIVAQELGIEFEVI